jgi:RNA polymerase sigma factor (sigma-70 family)
MERELVERARSRDRAAFEAIVQMRVDAVYRASLAILGNPDDAANATRNTFISAWSRISNVRDPDRFDAWLGRITVNAWRAQLRSPLPVQTPEAVSANAFDRAFTQLSLEDRAILVLHHLQQRSAPELAAALGIPEATIKDRLYGARVALGSALAKEPR